MRDDLIHSRTQSISHRITHKVHDQRESGRREGKKLRGHGTSVLRKILVVSYVMGKPSVRTPDCTLIVISVVGGRLVEEVVGRSDVCARVSGVSFAVGCVWGKGLVEAEGQGGVRLRPRLRHQLNVNAD